MPTGQRNRDTVADDFLDRVKIYTKSHGPRLESMLRALYLIESEKIPGDIVECGVWRGGNIMLARMLAPGRACWMYDTFEGMTEPHHELDVKRPKADGSPGEKAIDRYRAKIAGGTKWDAVSLEEVQAGFDALNLDRSNIYFVKGRVETTVDAVAPLRIAILRLDVDWYLPTKVAMEKLYPRVVHGGFLIADDYGHWMGCKKAIDDFFGDDVPLFTDVDYSCRVFRRC